METLFPFLLAWTIPDLPLGCYNFKKKTLFLVHETTVITAAHRRSLWHGWQAFSLKGGETLRTCQKVHFSKSVKKHSINQCQWNEVCSYKSKEIKFLKLHYIWPQSEKGQTTSKMPAERQLFISERSLAYVADRWSVLKAPEYKTSTPLLHFCQWLAMMLWTRL